jgi:rod shape determining protein RodA
MNMNLFPVSGLTLPFISYGGSSLLSSLLGIGLVESVILRHKQIEL